MRERGGGKEGERKRLPDFLTAEAQFAVALHANDDHIYPELASFPNRANFVHFFYFISQTEPISLSLV